MSGQIEQKDVPSRIACLVDLVVAHISASRPPTLAAGRMGGCVLRRPDGKTMIVNSTKYG
jgi:hypothetical protein